MRQGLAAGGVAQVGADGRGSAEKLLPREGALAQAVQAVEGGGQPGQAAAALPALAPSPGRQASRTDPLRALAYALQSLNL